MCGIAGVFAYQHDAPEVDVQELLRVRDSMAARGPDGAGLWVGPGGRSALAHRRLAIIDLSDAGAQPMSTVDGRLHISFNGEIYNFRTLRAALIAKGHAFTSSSDTEVLLQLYRDRGPSMVEVLRGMYAFAIFDSHDGSAFLARDPFGIKPLYYSDDGSTLRFASQVKALLAGGAIGAKPDAAGHVGFFVLGSVPEPFTMYSGIRAMPAGSTLTCRLGSKPRLHRYFRIGEEFARHEESAPGATQDIRDLADALRESVRDHMVADVPVGLFLSSGLDSTTVGALAREVTAGSIRSLTLGFKEYEGGLNDETGLAAETAGHLGTSHTTRFVERPEFEAEFDRLLKAMDQPSIDGVNTYFVSKAAAEAGMKVALSGLGGDELFGGYPSFRQVPPLAASFRAFRSHPRLGALIRSLAAPFVSVLTSPKWSSLAEYGGTLPGAYLLRRALYMPWEVQRFLDPDFFRDGWERLGLLQQMHEDVRGLRNDRAVVSTLEMEWYMKNQLLRDADWAGMAHSLEIRAPLVDVELFRRVAPLICSTDPPTKVRAARSSQRPLPEKLFSRSKTGFSIPVHQWATRARRGKGVNRLFRNWAHIVHEPYKSKRALALLSDAFGGYGGIALYNRDLLTSLCETPEFAETVAVPRLITRPMEELPPGLVYRVEAATGKAGFIKTISALLLSDRDFDIVICCHINLLPAAVFAKWRTGAPLVTFLYGIDAWNPTGWLGRRLLKHVDRFFSISDVTRAKFQSWSRISNERFAILPNAVHLDWYGAAPKSADLVQKYRLEGKVVLMTLGRLVSSERYKGFDEVLNAMPGLLAEIPALVYMIVGDGSDRARLSARAAELGLLDRVVFTGHIDEARKADYYRLADAFVMPSRGEGFGFVLLEAMACGIPAVASCKDGGREAIREGQLGVLVDPESIADVQRGIREALRRGRAGPPDGLVFFAFPNFRSRVREEMLRTIRASIARPASG